MYANQRNSGINTRNKIASQVELCLVTSPLRDSFDHVHKNVFLSLRSLPQDKNDLLDIDYEIAKPFANNPKKRKEIFELSSRLFHEILNELTNELNSFHKVSFSKRYWHIIIGPWLHIYLKIILNRYLSLISAQKQYNFTKSIFIERDDYSLCDNTNIQFRDKQNDDYWNHFLFAKLLEDIPRIDLISMPSQKNKRKINHEISKKRTKLLTFKKLLTFFSKYIILIKKDTDSVIYKSYLSTKLEILATLSLKEFPVLYSSPKIQEFEEDARLRETFFQDYNSFSGIERVARKMIHLIMPKCYLEGYNKISQEINNLNWPHNPKFIFTSNAYEFDEIFKFWVALKVENGAPYFIGQHGSNYGTLYESKLWPEMNTCDKFFTWGWSNNDEVPAFNFKTADKNITHDPLGGLLIITRWQGHFDGYHDKFYQHQEYLKYVSNFYKKLEYIQGFTTLRLHHNSLASDFQFWGKFVSPSKIDCGKSSLESLIKENRLLVYTYDSAGILESLTLDLPFICFWPENYDNLNNFALPFYKSLEKVGIFHTSVESASMHILNNWENISGWWNDDEVKKTRIKFYNHYARKEKKPVKKIKELLLQNI